MRIKLSLSIFLALSVSLCTLAQTSYDAFQVMGEDLNGTARYVGMGGAMGAFGSDLSVISRNPAGIGTYLSSDVNISFALQNSNTSMINPGSELMYDEDPSESAATISYSSPGNRSGMNFHVEDVSFVVVMPTYGTAGSLSNVNLAFSYHRLKDLVRTLTYNDDFEKPGYPVEFRDLVNNQDYLVNAYDFNVSFNHEDKFYWGFTFETLTASCSTTGHFYHYYPKGQLGLEKPLDITSVDRMNDIYGRGWNFKFGFIARPEAGPFRFGLSVSTPSFFRLNEEYTDYVYAIDGEQYDGKKFYQDTFFKMTTPWVLNGSLGYSTKHTAIGFEYDCNIAKDSYLRVSNTDLSAQGKDRDYRTYSALRLGMETNVSNFSIRCGYNYTFPMFNSAGMKYLEDTYFNKKRMDLDYENVFEAHTFTAGVGYCSTPGSFGGQFYVDLAYAYNLRYSSLHLGEYPYDPVTEYRTGTGKLLFTIGYTF